MLKINKAKEPQFLLDYKRKKSPKTWDDYNDKEMKDSIKNYILSKEQNYYCPYCEKRIQVGDEGHIEHIKPRDKFSKQFQDYTNLIVSCNEKLSCEKFKGNEYSPDFINPVIDNPEEYLTFNLVTGEIIPIYDDSNDIRNKKAKCTIKILNLNYYTLREARRDLIIMLIKSYGNNKEYLQYLLDDGYNFPSLIKYYIESI